MHEARYEDPIHPDVRKKFHPLEPSIACVIPLYIPAGRKKDYGYFVEDKFETLQKTLAAHRHFAPGVAYDLILVDNGSPQDVDAFKIKPVRKLFHRKNEGFGFGAWRAAWRKYGAEYDFFLFTEDDNAPARDGWLREIYELFHSADDIGAVGNIVEAHGHNVVADEVRALRGMTREAFYNFDGAFTFTSSEILRQVDRHGGLPVYPCQPHYPRAATVNELAFQQPILELGYRLVSFADCGRMIIHGSELYTGDLANRGPVAPIINHNAGQAVPEVKELFSWYG